MKIIILSFSILLPYIAFTQPLDARSLAYFDSITRTGKPDPYIHPHISTIAEIPITTYSEIYYSTQRFDSAMVLKTLTHEYGVRYEIPPNSSMVIRTYPAFTPSGTGTDTFVFQSAQTADSLYELIKARYIGKKFVFAPLILFNTDDQCKGKANRPDGMVWTVTGVRRLSYDKTSNLDIPLPLAYERLICKAENGDCATVDLTYFSEQKKAVVYTPEKAAKLKAKYGVTFWHAILSGHVKLGMNHEMCIQAWGHPSSTNITHSVNGTIEQWIYYYYAKNIMGESFDIPQHVAYLYFTNGLLTAYQN